MSKTEINIQGCDGSEYVLFPACAYNGNKFEVLKKDYPPMFSTEEARLDMPVTITDVPRLEKDGGGKIEVTTGDVAAPCVGVFSESIKKAVLVHTVQEIDGINLGLAYEKGKISITYPAYREYFYYDTHMHKNDEYADIEAEIPYKVLEFECDSIEQFYRVYFENRKVMGLDDSRPQILPFDEQFRIQKKKFNDMNWRDKLGFYGVGTENSRYQIWQPGWVGGAMSSYALMKLGGELEYRRSVSTLNHLFNVQGKSGLFYGICDEDGNVTGDGFDNPGTENWTLTRKSADCLYFLFKHFAVMESIPEHFVEGTKKLADRFVTIWKEYGQIGQFADVETGELIVGGSCSAAIVSAGLVKASGFFNNEAYLCAAKEIADYFYENFAKKGYTTGGPGEMLQCPDSESAFALLESLVVLYEETNEQKWLDYAEFTAHQCSSWVVSYNYKFPEGSEFARLDMKSVGSVFANVQNKHSAPGICTLSGDSLYKLHKWTNNEMYKELYDDITLTISQYMSTDERPVYSWDAPEKRGKLPQGFICERVNMSDWEGFGRIGGVFNGSCWCETSNLLVMADYAE